ncbi:MAG: hypothetical protein JKY37_05005 [Nannocystaceae bacterium]|nr:hypothetical protein [Nannocystaceae bacterium]
MNNLAVSNSHPALAELCAQHDLLLPDAEGITRVPFLIKGELRVPDRVSIAEIRKAFAARDDGAGPSDTPATQVRIGSVQVLREHEICRASLTRTGRWLYTAMPTFEASELLEGDLDALNDDLYEMPVRSLLDFVGTLRGALWDSDEFIDQVRQATLATTTHPDWWHDTGFAAIVAMLDPDQVDAAINRELGVQGHSGADLLDGWCSVPNAETSPTPVNLLAEELFDESEFEMPQRAPQIRAMPTRQLHITAGNAPQIPFLSALRAISSKSAAVIKSPFGATTPGALLTLAMAAAAPDHPITRHMSIVYWPGGDTRVEQRLFAPNAFDRIVVWGAPEAVGSVKQRAVFTKVLAFNPRYSVSFVGPEAFQTDLTPIAIRAVADCLVANQKACIASQVVYVQGDDAQIAAFAQAAANVLAKFDAAAPNPMEPRQIGAIKRLQRSKFLDAKWWINERDGDFCSGVVVAPRAFDIASHPMCRLIVIRQVASASECAALMHPGVSTVSVYPNPSAPAGFRNALAARGVSNIVPLGHSGTAFAGQPHDGMLVLSELVDWKNS